MKINPYSAQGINPYKRQMNKMDQHNQTVSKTSDKVEISSTAKEMQHISQIPDQRQAKVEELKMQIENGTYKIDSKEAAKSIVSFYSK